MVFIYIIYFSFMLNYILPQSNIILRQWHNDSPDPLFILSTREYYTAYTANLLISLAEHTFYRLYILIICTDVCICGQRHTASLLMIQRIRLVSLCGCP